MRDLNLIYGDIISKVEAEAVRHGGEIGYIPAEDGLYEDMSVSDVSWWTNGFWGGMMWQCFKASGKEVFKVAAKDSEKRLDEALSSFLGLHHDVGFMWLPTSGASYRLTGDMRSYARLLHAATILAGRYNPDGRFIRSWNDDKTGWVIIDSLINLNILYVASRLTGDPRFRQIAMHHADTVMKQHIREDGSSAHIVSLDPDDGHRLEVLAGQGKSPDSSWTRGQSWALYGFTLSYRHTGKQEYLETATKVAGNILERLEACSYVVPVDFQDLEDPRTDNCAASIIACGLLELHEITGNPDYKAAAVRLINILDTRFADYSTSDDGIIMGCTGAFHCKNWNDVKMQYADYYFIEAVLKLLGKAFSIWY